jgi:hypothetical protein
MVLLPDEKVERHSPPLGLPPHQSHNTTHAMKQQFPQTPVAPTTRNGYPCKERMDVPKISW